MAIKKLRNVLLLACFLTFFIFVLTGIKISRYAVQFSDRPSDAAIVLGAAIRADKPSPVFRERINHAVNLYKQDKIKVLIFTGGIGKGQSSSEAEVAKKFAINKGVSAENILIETRSTITFENLTEAKALLAANGLETVLLVSDPLHMKRAMKMADDLNINAVSSPTPTSLYKSWPVRMKFLMREIFFYIGYLLFG